MWKTWLVVVLLAGTTAARAELSDECRMLSGRLATDPGSLKVGELDVLKNCLSDLQRDIVLGNPLPAKSEPVACVPPEPVATACPVCATAAQLCPRREAAPVRERAQAPAREPSEDRRLRPFLPKY